MGLHERPAASPLTRTLARPYPMVAACPGQASSRQRDRTLVARSPFSTVAYSRSDALCRGGATGRGACSQMVLGREEERVLAEALWSRPTVRIGGAEEDLQRFEIATRCVASALRAASRRGRPRAARPWRRPHSRSGWRDAH